MRRPSKKRWKPGRKHEEYGSSVRDSGDFSNEVLNGKIAMISLSEAPIVLTLSGLPPSLWGAYYQRRGGPGKCLTPKANAWKNGAIIADRQGRLTVTVYFRVKSRGRWDIDNRYKLLLDALTEAGVWADDSRIDDLRGIVEVDGRKKPETVVKVWERSVEV